MPLSCNLGTLTTWNPLGPSGPVTGLLFLSQLIILRFASSRTCASHLQYSSTLTMEAVPNCGQFHPDCTVSQPRRQQTHLHNRNPENCKTFCNFYGFLSTHCFISCFLVTLCIASFLSFLCTPLYRMLESSSTSSVLLLRTSHIQLTTRKKN